MKKTLIALMALAGVACAATPEWSAVQTDPTHVTYTTTQIGSFTFDDLGDAAIAEGEAFSITMHFVAPSNPFVQGNGLSFLAAKNGSTADLYDINGGNDQFRLYIRNSGEVCHFSVNNWSYGKGANTDAENYTSTVPTTVSADTPVIIGMTFTYSGGPAATNNFTLSPTADSQIQFDTITDQNVVRSYNFSDLTNYTGTYTNAPSDMVTTISITKAGVLPTPEPATATLSLLALAGLASRRRRH